MNSIPLSLSICIFLKLFCLCFMRPLGEHDSWLREWHLIFATVYRSKELCNKNVFALVASLAAGLIFWLKAVTFGLVKHVSLSHSIGNVLGCPSSPVHLHFVREQSIYMPHHKIPQWHNSIQRLAWLGWVSPLQLLYH